MEHTMENGAVRLKLWIEISIKETRVIVGGLGPITNKLDF